MSDRPTASAYLPRYLLREAHRRQYASVSLRAFFGKLFLGIFSRDEPYLSVNSMLWPLRTVNSLVVVWSSPRNWALVSSTTISEPATARSSLLEVTQGTVRP